MSPLPTVPEAITAEWLDGVLSAQNVRAVHMDDVMHGSTTKVFVRAELGDGRLLSFCVKGVFDEPRLPVRVLAAQQEALFFRELAPNLEIRRFRTWFADTDEQQGVVMFDDLRQSGTVFTAGEPPGTRIWWRRRSRCRQRGMRRPGTTRPTATPG